MLTTINSVSQIKNYAPLNTSLLMPQHTKLGYSTGVFTPKKAAKQQITVKRPEHYPHSHHKNPYNKGHNTYISETHF
ncbi:MAG: hypothetical protein ACPLKZ_00860, partial [Candidatus Bathyarchaeales archaeon]